MPLSAPSDVDGPWRAVSGSVPSDSSTRGMCRRRSSRSYSSRRSATVARWSAPASAERASAQVEEEHVGRRREQPACGELRTDDPRARPALRQQPDHEVVLVRLAHARRAGASGAARPEAGDSARTRDRRRTRRRPSRRRRPRPPARRGRTWRRGPAPGRRVAGSWPARRARGPGRRTSGACRDRSRRRRGARAGARNAAEPVLQRRRQRRRRGSRSASSAAGVPRRAAAAPASASQPRGQRPQLEVHLRGDVVRQRAQHLVRRRPRRDRRRPACGPARASPARRATGATRGMIGKSRVSTPLRRGPAAACRAASAGSSVSRAQPVADPVDPLPRPRPDAARDEREERRHPVAHQHPQPPAGRTATATSCARRARARRTAPRSTTAERASMTSSTRGRTARPTALRTPGVMSTNARPPAVTNASGPGDRVGDRHAERGRAVRT